METTKDLVKNNVGNGNESSEMKIENISLNSLVVKYHPRNTLGDIESLQRSIKRDGLQEPLLVYDVGENQYAVIDGVRRLATIQEFGWQTVPCLIRKGLTDAEAAHLAYIKNEERKTLSAIEIARHIRTMKDEFGYTLNELGLKGYGSPANISLKLKLIELPESIQRNIQEGTLTAEHGRHLAKLPSAKVQERMAKRIIDHDLNAKRTETQIRRFLAKGSKKAKDKVQFPESEITGVYFKDSKDMSELPDKSVALIITSPPYLVGMEFEKGISDAEHWENISAVMDECARVLVDGGIMALNVGDIHNFRGKNGQNDFTQIQLVGHKYQAFLRRNNIYLTDIIAWVKSTNSYGREIFKAWSNDTQHTDYRIIISHDPVYIFRKKGEREIPSEEIALKSRLTREEWSRWAHGIWQIPRVHNMEGHPAMYPDELVNRLVRMFSYVGDTILDPFLGSGTTVKVARELNRDGIGYERELQYKPVIMKKLGLIPEQAVDEGSETVAEFFKRVMPPEPSEPFVETIPVNSGKAVQNIEPAEEFSEASMPF